MEETNHLNNFAHANQNTFDDFAASPSTALFVRPSTIEDDDEEEDTDTMLAQCKQKLKVRGAGDSDDDDDDRDRFSPPLNVHENIEFGCGAGSNSTENNNERVSRCALSDSARLASKEEKQRQNEEIVIMESSSISSETGSWESFLPQRGADGGEPKEMCRSFLSSERRACSSSQTSSPKLSKESTEEKPLEPSGESPVDATGTEFVNEEVPTPKPIGACFIDASTLLDEGEIGFSSSNTMSPVAARRRRDSDDSKVVVNMSDEQKLNNSTKLRDSENDIKDQYASDNSLSKESRPNLSSLLSEPPTHPTGVRPSHEQERKQGNYLFQNSIQQFSGHVMSPKMAYAEDNNSDFSLPSVYSGGSSDPYNDCASAFETSSHHSSNYGDRDGELVQFSIGGNGKNDSMLIYPDTPHNSILHVDMFHRHSIPPTDSAIASLSSSESTAASMSRTNRLHDERDIPIVSGGASVKDFTPKQCESPSMKRKTEDCPIISLGGMHSLDFDTKPMPKPRSIDRQSASAVNSWVVDMSDCNNKKNKRRSSESSSTSTEYSGRYGSVDRSGSASSHKGLGFYVSLSDMKPPRLADEETLSKSLNYHTVHASHDKRKATGFFVDFSNDDSSNASNTPALSASGAVNSDTDSMGSKKDEKQNKNIFSMFIDFGAEKKMTTTPNPIAAKRTTTIPATEGAEATTTTTAVTVREHKRSASNSSEKGIMSILDKIPLISKTSSMSIDTPNSPFDDFTCSKSLSSYSNNSLTSLSVHSSNGGGDAATVNNRQDETGNRRRRQRDAKIGETFDKSSQGSLTDGILSKNSSPTLTTDNEDITYNNNNNENGEAVRSCNAGVMETIPETKEAAVVLRRTQHTMETLQATIEKQKQLLNTVTEEPASLSSSSFVKLSDMDKPIPKFELHNDTFRPRSVGSRIGKLFDSKIGSRNTWHHMSKSTGNNLTNLASSVENLRSLTRIFPHLGKDLSNSLPTNFEQDYNSLVLSPGEMAHDLLHSDISTSSATSSSISRSGMDSNDEFSLSCRQPRRLGEDLLKMFLQEIATDVVIEVNGRRMRAHKCILRSRCQYFAAILAGGWVESAGNVISLSGYSYGSVHFALCHIYSGAAHPPDGISLMELATLADLLGLEGLKEVAAYSLKTNYCHSFHKPCSGCIDGVMQVFPVSLNQGLDDLYRKCLRWTCKHSLKVWPSRSFSQLPAELITRCKQHIIAHMTSESVIYTLLDCDQLLALLAPCRWAANVEASVRDIIDAGHDYVVDHFASLIASDGFLSLGQGLNWNISRLENMLLRSGSSLTPDQACRSYQRITRLNSVLHAKINKFHTSRIDKNIFNSDYGNDIDEFDPDEEDDDLDWNPEFIRLVGEILLAVEQCLIRQCSRAMKSIQWTRMDAELQKKIQKLACLSDPVERRPRTVPRPPAYSSPVLTQSSRAHDLYQVKMAIQAHSRRSHEVQTNKVTTQVPVKTERTNHNVNPVDAPAKTTTSGTGKVLTKSSSKSQVPDLISTAIKTKKPNAPIKPERSASTSAVHRRSAPAATQHITKDRSTASVDTLMRKPSTLHEVKSRYLEPKRPVTAAVASNNNKDGQLKVRNRSSSGSSRTSSPCISFNRYKDSAMLQNGQKTLSDSITMSRDSLSSPAKKNDKTIRKTASREQHDQLSVDSLGNSARSSNASCNKTASQDSLLRRESHKSSDSNPKLTGDKPHANQPIKSISGSAVHKLFSQSPSVTSSTPSSIATLKSRLSTNSTISSPRDNLKSRHTTPANPAPLAVKTSTPKTQKSFLSARSRQILAQKKTLSHSDSSKSVPSALKEKSSVSTPVGVNKSQSTSNILTRRPNPLSTTLHLRRTAKVSPPPLSIYTGKPATNNSQHSLMNPTKSSAMKMVSQNNKLNREHSAGNESRRKTLPKRDPVDLDDSGNCADVDEQQPSQRIESKLERSSTFCKERSEIPTSELQIID